MFSHPTETRIKLSGTLELSPDQRLRLSQSVSTPPKLVALEIRSEDEQRVSAALAPACNSKEKTAPKPFIKDLAKL